jgi:hypothetical protein
MKIVKLFLDEDSLLGGIDAVALVEQPAIEEDFFMFAKEEFETYNDYPKAAIEAAKQGIKRNKEGGNKCATQVGKVRAQQLANGESLSLDTIRRMRSFLIRQKDNYDLAVKRKDYEACGYISYLLWGGPAALPWAEKKLRQAGEEFIEPNPCQAGYEAIGLKNKGGRQVPNCVPIKASKIKDTIIEELIKQEMAKIGSIDNVAVYETIEEAEAAAKEMGCEGYHEHLDGKDVIGYMPCKSHETAISEGTETGVAAEDMDADVSALPNFINELPQDKQDAILNALSNVGINEDVLASQGYVEVPKSQYNTCIEHAFRISSDPNKGSIADFGAYKVLYKYEGPRDSKNRDFCARMLSKNLVFRKEDINELSVSAENSEFGFYDIFKWRGSYNCRHVWTAKLFKKTDTENKRAAAAELPGLGSALSTKPIDAATGKTTGLTTTVSEESFSALDERQMLVGPLMIPNKLIKRVNEEGEYYVYFDKDTVQKLAYRFMEDKLTDSVNIEHNNDDRPNDVFLAESWIIEDEDKDKSRAYNMSMPEGTWMGIYKVNNNEIWDEYIKTGRVKGFSVEGFFAEKLDQYSK